jgi:hypothetical protein
MPNEILADILPKIRPEIPMNPHLHAGGPGQSLDKLLLIREAAAQALAMALPDLSRSGLIRNLHSLSEALIRGVHARYGESGLFKLQFLAAANDAHDFDHFSGMIASDLSMRSLLEALPSRPLDPDNIALPAADEIDRFCHNVINTSLSRKLYNPGRREGFVVHGLGGPKILISLPFLGTDRFTYPVFENSADIVTSLMIRGYAGTFLALDRLGGMEADYYGFPGWLVWFSFLAAHSDLVVFVTEAGGGLSKAQRSESRLTPDRVPKKVVELGLEELSWAKKSLVQVDQDLEQRYAMPGKGMVSQDEYFAAERKFAEPFIRLYDRGSFPNDRLIVLNEDGTISEFPLPGPARAPQRPI